MSVSASYFKWVTVFRSLCVPWRESTVGLVPTCTYPPNLCGKKCATTITLTVILGIFMVVNNSQLKETARIKPLKWFYYSKYLWILKSGNKRLQWKLIREVKLRGNFRNYGIWNETVCWYLLKFPLCMVVLQRDGWVVCCPSINSLKNYFLSFLSVTCFVFLLSLAWHFFRECTPHLSPCQQWIQKMVRFNRLLSVLGMCSCIFTHSLHLW